MRAARKARDDRQYRAPQGVSRGSMPDAYIGSLGELRVIMDGIPAKYHSRVLEAYRAGLGMRREIERHPYTGLELPRDESSTLKGLNEREHEILALVIQGFRNMEIAAQLYLAEITVKKLVQSITRKLGVRNRVEAAVYAVQHGFGSSQP